MSPNVIHKGSRSHTVSSARIAHARTVALAWLATYLAVSAIILLTSGHIVLVTAHILTILIAVRSVRPTSELWRIIGDLLPLFVAPVLYTEIPKLIAALHGSTVAYRDTMVEHWELGLLGTQAARTFAPAIPSAFVSEILHGGYLLYYAVIFIPPLALFVRNERVGLGQTLLALTITATVCWTIFSLFPVEGPRYAWGPSRLVPDGILRRITLQLLAAGSSRGTAFPSSHVAIAMTQTVLAFRWQPKFARILAVVTAMIGLGAVYGGFHYAVDTIAGAALGGMVGVAVLNVTRRRMAQDD